jgi:hypothetical protein
LDLIDELITLAVDHLPVIVGETARLLLGFFRQFGFSCLWTNRYSLQTSMELMVLAEEVESR